MLLSFSLDQAKVWHDWPSSKYASVNAVFVILHHNAAARLILILRLQDHVTLALQQLHWMPIDYRITYKLSYMHLLLTSCTPQYLSDCIQTDDLVSDLPTQLHMSSRGAEPGLESVASVMLDPLLGTVFQTTFFKSVTLAYSNARLKTELFHGVYHR